MRSVLVLLAVVMAGCAHTKLPEIEGTVPVFTTQLRGEPHAASRCIVSVIESLGTSASVRDFGSETQVVWEMQRRRSPLGLFTLTKTPDVARSDVELRMSPGREAEPMARRWQKELEGCQ